MEMLLFTVNRPLAGWRPIRHVELGQGDRRASQLGIYPTRVGTHACDANRPFMPMQALRDGATPGR